MKIITGATENMWNMIENSQKKAVYWGYKLEATKFTPDMFPEVKKGTYNARIPFKPQFILDNLDDDVLYLDADAHVNGKLDIDWDFDIAVTMHPPKKQDRGDGGYRYARGRLNAGVIFVKNTDKAREFLKKWKLYIENFTEFGSDQEALHRMLWLHTDWNKHNTIDFLGVKVKLLNSDDYNANPQDGRGDKDSKILHYPGAWKKYYGKI